MTAKAVWIAGFSSLAVLCAVGLYRVLPVMEADLRASVDQALAVKGLHSVKADVSGQTVILSAATDTPEARAQLAEAKLTLADVTMNEPVLPGGKLVNSPISAVQVVGAPNPSTSVAVNSGTPVVAVLPAKSVDKTPAIEIIHGDGATAVASLNTSANDLPRVAGDSALDASTQAARSCDQDIAAAMSSRQVSYKPGTYDLTPESQTLIGDVYKVVAACPVQVRLTVSGYTDNLGDGMVNQTISQARAQAAADALIARGLAPGRVTVRGFGGALPVADNTTAEGRAKNRRVVFTVNAG
ncbi:OmpA family protein [Asticcacaulis sp.]|uniref:OmpA family protein n=1 Tax=Asticcacaulis sp. TaxID=1872648 RepID=UPI002CFB8EF5|nr:OmpA family protein [Asticcacaulis sp.]HTM83244.1 OmpA family protein [Asticcacaulis sp.]